MDNLVWSINASTSPLGGAQAVWSSQYVMHDPATDFVMPSLAAVEGPGGTVLYLVARDNQGTGSGRIMFSRSLDQGSNWDSPYVVGPQAANSVLDATEPAVAADELGNVHVAYRLRSKDLLQYDDGIYYRHATAWGVSLPAWGSVKALDPATDGNEVRNPDVAAQPDGSAILVGARRTGGPSPGYVRWTASGDGTGFSPTQLSDPATQFGHCQLLAHPDGGWLQTGAEKYLPQSTLYGWAIVRSGAVAPPNWQDVAWMADYRYNNFVSHAAVAVIDPTRGNAVALLWSDVASGSGDDYLRFDASFRDGPGYPNHATNFPVELDHAAVTDPALHEVNPFRSGPELVYAGTDGMVHVLDTNTGEDVPGWPQAIGAVDFGQTVAVGDIDGNGIYDVVASNAAGEVFAWRGDGSLLAGWPVQVGNGASFVSLGTVTRLAPMDVVVATSTHMHLLRPDGSEFTHGNLPVALPAAPVGPVSLGDVDDDGYLNLVPTMGNRVGVYDHEGSLGWMGIFAAGMQTPTALGDLDADGDLELVIPGGDGVIHARHHSGAAVAGFWPQATMANEPITGLALAEIDAVAGVEVAALSEGGQAFLFRSTGFPYTGFPVATPDGSSFQAAPILDDVDGGRPELIAGDNFGWAVGAKEDATDLGGWPKVMPGQMLTTPVAGETDGDGNQYVMFMVNNKLVKLDPNDLSGLDPVSTWPMFAHDAQRTSCTDHNFDTVTAAPGPVSALVSFAPPSPNPTRGSTRLSYRLPGVARVQLDIFDMRGRRVRTVFSGSQPAGEYSLGWDARSNDGERVSQGIYFGRLSVQGSGVDKTLTQKISVVH